MYIIVKRGVLLPVAMRDWQKAYSYKGVTCQMLVYIQQNSCSPLDLRQDRLLMTLPCRSIPRVDSAAVHGCSLPSYQMVRGTYVCSFVGDPDIFGNLNYFREIPYLRQVGTVKAVCVDTECCPSAKAINVIANMDIHSYYDFTLADLTSQGCITIPKDSAIVLIKKTRMYFDKVAWSQQPATLSII